ncbi:hypothetical protein J6590_032522 [Homalodisca vitripennis]|nr:hypothetical protein J6590_032522 [Homalodisca vitripennis]
MDLQEAIYAVTERLETLGHARLDRSDHLNTMLEETLRGHTERPTFDMVGSITPFDGGKPEVVLHFFESIDNVGELSHWGNDEKLRVAKLRLAGTALSFIRSEDQGRLSTYAGFKEVLTQRFSDKASKDFYFQQLSVIQQRRGETIEAFADRVRTLNEKTVRVTANPEVNAALREKADRRALDAFTRGLIGHVGDQTRLKFPTNIREAVTTAVAIDHILKQSKDPSRATDERKVFQTDFVCHRCHNPGHTSLLPVVFPTKKNDSNSAE